MLSQDRFSFVDLVSLISRSECRSQKIRAELNKLCQRYHSRIRSEIVGLRLFVYLLFVFWGTCPATCRVLAYQRLFCAPLLFRGQTYLSCTWRVVSMRCSVAARATAAHEAVFWSSYYSILIIPFDINSLFRSNIYRTFKPLLHIIQILFGF